MVQEPNQALAKERAESEAELPARGVAIPLTAAVGSSGRSGYINQFVPANPWVARDTLTPTHSPQVYFDKQQIGFMNDSIPSAPEPKNQLNAPVEETPGSRPGAAGSPRSLWWLPVLSLAIGVGVAAAFVFEAPPTYVTTAHLWCEGPGLGLALGLGQGGPPPENQQEFLATQTDLLQSGMLAGRAYARVMSPLHVSASTNREGRPVVPRTKAFRNANSSIIEIQASSTTETNAVAYLSVLMDEFVAYQRERHASSLGDTYNSVSEQVLKQEAELRAEQEQLTAYMRTNNVAVFQAAAPIAVKSLERLITQLSDLKLEEAVFKGRKLSPTETAAEQTILMKMECLANEIKQTEDRIREGSQRLEQADRLKLNVERLQTLHERLLTTLQTVDLSKSLEHEQITILDRPGEPKRDFSREECFLAWGVCGGLGIGFGSMALLRSNRAWRRRHRCRCA